MFHRVLVAEDEPALAEVLTAYLARAGFEVRAASNGLDVLALADGWHPDLIILDLMLPRLSGLEVLHRLRSGGSDVLILVLSALGGQDDRVMGLERGADDYVAKPFSPRELVLRVGGLLRRQERSSNSSQSPVAIEVADLRIDIGARTVDRAGERLLLSNREFDLLVFLAGRPGEAFSKEDLLHHVWGWDYGDTSTVTVHVRRLREKIEADPSAPRIVVTIWGCGYRLERLATTDSSIMPSESSSAS